jgi:hypothetical protein
MSRSFCSFVIFLYCQSLLVWPKNCVVASASGNQSCTVAGFTSECLAQHPATPAYRGPSDGFHYRYDHSMVTNGSELLVFGGHDKVNNLLRGKGNELLQLEHNYTSNQESWQVFTAGSSFGRYDHTSTMFNNKLYIFGGASGVDSLSEAFTDVIFEFESFNARPVVVWTPATLAGSRWGKEEDQKLQSGIVKYGTCKVCWKRIYQITFRYSRSAVELENRYMSKWVARGCHSAIQEGSRMIVFAGRSTDGVAKSDVFYIDLFERTLPINNTLLNAVMTVGNAVSSQIETEEECRYALRKLGPLCQNRMNPDCAAHPTEPTRYDVILSVTKNDRRAPFGCFVQYLSNDLYYGTRNEANVLTIVGTWNLNKTRTACNGIDHDTGFFFSCISATWPPTVFNLTKPVISGDIPPRRYDHTATLVGKKMFVFGGIVSDPGMYTQVFNDIYYLNLSSWRWEKIQYGPDAVNIPSGRHKHTACVFMSSLIVFGGMSAVNQIFDELFIFDTTRQADGYWKDWTLVDWSGLRSSEKPEPVADHAAVILNGRLIVSGGVNSFGAKKTVAYFPLCGCGLCSPGQFTKSFSCSECPAGTYNTIFGAENGSFCTECGSGYYSDPGSVFCRPCPAGFHQPSIGSRGCILCAAGLYGNKLALPNCTKCPRGQYTLEEGQMSCLMCQSGQYQNETGSNKACIFCPPTTYSAELGRNNCTGCPLPGMFSLKGSTSAGSCRFCTHPAFCNTTAGKCTIPFRDPANWCNNCSKGSFQTFLGLCQQCPDMTRWSIILRDICVGVSCLYFLFSVLYLVHKNDVFERANEDNAANENWDDYDKERSHHKKKGRQHPINAFGRPSVCKACNQTFASKNKLFKHLRDPNGQCTIDESDPRDGRQKDHHEMYLLYPFYYTFFRHMQILYILIITNENPMWRRQKLSLHRVHMSILSLFSFEYSLWLFPSLTCYHNLTRRETFLMDHFLIPLVVFILPATISAGRHVYKWYARHMNELDLWGNPNVLKERTTQTIDNISKDLFLNTLFTVATLAMVGMTHCVDLDEGKGTTWALLLDGGVCDAHIPGSNLFIYFVICSIYLCITIVYTPLVQCFGSLQRTRKLICFPVYGWREQLSNLRTIGLALITVLLGGHTPARTKLRTFAQTSILLFFGIFPKFLICSPRGVRAWLVAPHRVKSNAVMDFIFCLLEVVICALYNNALGKERQGSYFAIDVTILFTALLPISFFMLRVIEKMWFRNPDPYRPLKFGAQLHNVFLYLPLTVILSFVLSPLIGLRFVHAVVLWILRVAFLACKHASQHCVVAEENRSYTFCIECTQHWQIEFASFQTIVVATIAGVIGTCDASMSMCGFRRYTHADHYADAVWRSEKLTKVHPTGAENDGTAHHGILSGRKVVLVPPAPPPPKFVVDHKVPLEHQTGYFGIWGGTPHDATTHPTNYHDDDDDCLLMSIANPKKMTPPRKFSPKQEFSSSYKPLTS